MKIYAGQTLEGTMVFTDDDGSLVTDFSQTEIKLLLRNRHDDYQVLLSKENMQIEGSQVKFTFSSDQTKKLSVSAIIEVKLIVGEVVRIAKQEQIEVVDNRIKDL
jgi:hypothetical protein|nr:MAG TPA: hypothetical protein [Bacteriophage sp.]